jgi:hypothetical protein
LREKNPFPPRAKGICTAKIAFARLRIAIFQAKRQPVGGRSRSQPAEPASPGFLELSRHCRAMVSGLSSGSGRPDRNLRTGGPVYLIGAELLRDKEPEREGRRLALLTHFRPEGSLEIKALIDLAGQRVLEFTARENPNASMSREEIEAAVALTLANPRVRAALGEDLARVKVEGLHLLTSDPKDPLYGHRAVRMLFKVGKLYRSAPVVIVDLTTRSVTIVPPRQAADHH